MKGKNRHVFPGVRPGQPVARTTVFDQCERVTGGKAIATWLASDFQVVVFRDRGAVRGRRTQSGAHQEKIVGAYDHEPMIERRRTALQAYANWLSGPATAEVIPLTRRA